VGFDHAAHFTRIFSTGNVLPTPHLQAACSTLLARLTVGTTMLELLCNPTYVTPGGSYGPSLKG
jgi:hypothetical protein